MIDGLRRDDIARAHDVIASHVRRTPVLQVNGAEVGLSSFPLTFKLEFMQHAGSFKARGAFTNLLSRARFHPSGVVAASGGNHGVAVAFAAKCLGIPAKIFVPTVASPQKIASHPRIRRRRRRLAAIAMPTPSPNRALGGAVARAADPRLRSDRDAARPGHARARNR